MEPPLDTELPPEGVVLRPPMSRGDAVLGQPGDPYPPKPRAPSHPTPCPVFTPKPGPPVF